MSQESGTCTCRFRGSKQSTLSYVYTSIFPKERPFHCPEFSAHGTLFLRPWFPTAATELTQKVTVGHNADIHLFRQRGNVSVSACF